MKRWMSGLCAAAWLCACAKPPTVPHAPSLAALQRAAAAQPADPGASRALALGELVLPGGDNARAEAALKRARQLGPHDPELLLAEGLLADVHGHPNRALEAYLTTIEEAVHAPSPGTPALVEVAGYALLGQSGLARGFSEQVRRRVSPLISDPQLSLSARAALVDVVMPLEFRRGDTAQVGKLAREIGCLTDVRVAGPFGPRELLGFDAAPPLAADGTLAQTNDLGPGRGTRATRTLRAQGCRLNLGGGEVADGGMSLAQADLTVPAAAEYTVRVDTPNSVELFVDGHSALRVDRRTLLGARVVLAKVTLTQGLHHLVVRLSSRHPNPAVEVSVVPYRASDAADVSGKGPVLSSAPFSVYERVAIALARGDVLAARQLLSGVARSQDASAMLLLQRSGIALSDPLLPDGVRADEARRYLTRAAARDAAAWAPVVQLASLAAKAGQVKESIAVLRKSVQRWPEVPAIGLALAELLRSKNFQAAADRELSRVREIVPDACSPMAAQLDALRTRQRYDEIVPLTEELLRCDAQSSARYNLFIEQRDFAGAARELARLDTLQPETGRYASLLAKLALAKNQNDAAAAAGAVQELRTRYPRSFAGALEQIDALEARGRHADALAAISVATRAEPAAMAGLYRVGEALGQKQVLSAYRKDGLAAIRAFESSGKKYDGPQVLVLDYMAMRLFEDGSSLELIHTVQKAQSDEAVDRLGEVEVPEGAQVLTLRAIKRDGRVLEADNIAGKNTVSLPNLAQGDYVELEYLQAKAPSDGFPGGYLGERFYFKSFEIPFHHSQMVLLLPEAMPYQLDPRGAAPEPRVSVQGGLRVLDFAVDESVPLVEEPNSVSAREFIPSTRIGVHASFEALVESLRDVLVDRNLYDPYWSSVAKQIVGDAAPQDHRLRAERLYAWVLANVENNNEVFSQAALMLRARSGNRARVLQYMLGLAGVPAQLALARSFGGDFYDGKMADAETYDHMLVLIDPGSKQPMWLYTNERWAPFGFLPTALRGQPALVLEAGAPKVLVSSGAFGPDVRRFVVDAQLGADGGARLDITEQLHGSESVAWRGQLEQIPKAELSRRMEQDYVSRLFPGASLVSLEIAGRELAAPDLALHYVLDVPSYARVTADGLALPAVLPSEISGNFARTATRKITELLPSPVQTELDMTLHLPNGVKLASTPAPEDLVGAFEGRPRFVDRVSVDGTKLHLQRSLTLPAMRIEPQVYPAFAEFCRRVDEIEGRELYLTAAH